MMLRFTSHQVYSGEFIVDSLLVVPSYLITNHSPLFTAVTIGAAQ